MKTCSHCANNLSENSVFCDQCGRPVDPATPIPAVPRVKWFFRPTSLIAMFLLVGPLMLPAVWFHPKYSITKKIVVTVIVVGLTVVLIDLTAKALTTIGNYYGQIGQTMGM